MNNDATVQGGWQDFRYHTHRVFFYPKGNVNRIENTKISSEISTLVDDINNINKSLSEKKDALIKELLGKNGNKSLTPKEAAEITDKLNNDPEVITLKKQVRDKKTQLDKLEKEFGADLKNTLKRSVGYDISSIISNITCDVTDDKLAEARVSFSDIAAEVFASMRIGDYITIELGWNGATSERFKLQDIFQGIITCKEYSKKGNSLTNIICNDEKVLLDAVCKTEVKGVDGINDDDAAKEKFGEVGLKLNATGGTDRATKIQVEQTDLEWLLKTAKTNGQQLTQLKDGTYQLIPKGIKDNMYVYALGENIIGITYREQWQKPTDENSGKDGNDEDVANAPNSLNIPVQNDIPNPKGTPKAPPTGVGNDPNSLRTLSEGLAKENAMNEVFDNSIDNEIDLEIPGEPSITNTSMFYLLGVNPYINMFYEVKSRTHNYGPDTFTTNLKGGPYGVPKTIDINTVIKAYITANRNISGQAGQPVMKDSEQPGEQSSSVGTRSTQDVSAFPGKVEE